MGAYLVDRFVLPPAHCAICRWGGSSDDRQIIDTRATISERLVDGRLVEEGRLYLCSACVTELATMLRFVPPDLVDRFVAERDTAIERVKALELEVASYDAIRDLVTSMRPSEPVELEATKRNQCPDCDFVGQNRGALARHRESKHGAPHGATRRGDEVLEIV